MQHKIIQTEDGRFRAMCPNDGTWGFLSDAQYEGKAECVCPHPECGHRWTHDYAADAAEASAKAAPADNPADHF